MHNDDVIRTRENPVATEGDVKKRTNDPAPGITEDSVLVLRGPGPLGGPGMPGYGVLPIPDHLPDKGVRDLARDYFGRLFATAEPRRR